MINIKRLSAIALVVPLVIASFATIMSVGGGSQALADQPTNLHCPNHETEIKVETSGSPQTADETVTIDGQSVRVNVTGEEVKFFDSSNELIKVKFCVKGGNELPNSGEKQAKQYTHPQEISYVVVYRVVEEQEDDKPEAEVTIIKDVVDGEDEEKFEFYAGAKNLETGEIDYSAWGPFMLDDYSRTDTPNQVHVPNVGLHTSNVFTVTEKFVDGWNVDIKCMNLEDAVSEWEAGLIGNDHVVTLTLVEDSHIQCTFENEKVTEDEEEKPTENGDVLGDKTNKDTGETLGTQVDAPVGAVDAGVGATGFAVSSILGLAGSISALGYGALRFGKSE
ncbi:MAG: hypothetical protein U5L95_05425 [Candidatus Saccharibacteria bacterium]|nr:hypothetical protein [Candidatus Saccharibacteria bacterium]